MAFSPASTASVTLFGLIVLTVLIALLWSVQHGYRSSRTTGLAALFLAVWLGTLSLVVTSGRLSSLPLSGLPLFFGPIVLIWTGLGLSPVGRRLATHIPLVALVAFQGFRLPLELVLHSWSSQGTIPVTMTWTGQNWDIVSGITALVCAPFVQRHRAAAWVANLVGFALLINVMRVALFSSPVSFGWGTQPPLLLAFHLPYTLIGPVCVGGALFGHLVLTRALLIRRSH